MIRYEDIARSIQVRHLQVAVDEAVRFSVADDARKAERALRPRGYDQAPVVDGARVVGTVRTVDLATAATIGDAFRPIEAAELVSADAPVSSLLEWLRATPCLYVLDGRDITGFVVESDLNKQPARVYFYMLIANLELALAQRLRAWMGRDEGRLLSSMSGVMAENVQQRKAQARAVDADTDLVAYLTFSEILRVCGRIDAVRNELGFGSQKAWEVMKPLIELRNAVMHPTKELIGRDCRLDALIERDHLLRDLLTRVGVEGGSAMSNNLLAEGDEDEG